MNASTSAPLRQLGSSSAQIPALGFGCMGLVGWYGTRNDAEAQATLLAAADAGKAMQALRAAGETVWRIGAIEAGPAGEPEAVVR